MNLIVDIGNSGMKIALFKGGEMHDFIRIDKPGKRQFSASVRNLVAARAIISSVAEIPGYVPDTLSEVVSFVHTVSSSTRLPFPVNYKTPETLGSDRIAGICGAFIRAGGRDSLVIDAGSALTFDYFTGGHYRGGNISPGLVMRFRALNRFSGRLPLVKPSGHYPLPGDTTASAIEAGVVTGILYEINEYIRTFKEDHKDSVVFITGGDSSLMAEKINDRSVISAPWLVLEGLNYILDYNAG